jgi:hypothetical protein
MKKEGLLGSAFLDESEVELSLNEYGKAGWELVSMLETLDGLIAVFKQPLSFGGSTDFLQDEEEQKQSVPPIPGKPKGDTVERIPRSAENRGTGEVEVVPIDDYEVVEEDVDAKGNKQSESDVSIDVGSIRIE